MTDEDDLKMAEVFPPSWMRPEALPWVKDLIKHLPVDARVKKRTLQEWATHVGVKLTAELVEEVTGLPAGEV
ncbi:hypothetical protein ES703_103838 [subsurface metagenome]